jgi:hypothetical protein
MNADLGFSASVFGFAGGIFFVSYALLEVPSNMLMMRFGTRLWVTRIMISWGVISAAQMFVTTPTQFYALRFLLGAAEAGFFPAILYYASLWFPAQWRGRVPGRPSRACPRIVSPRIERPRAPICLWFTIPEAEMHELISNRGASGEIWTARRARNAEVSGDESGSL